MQNLAIILNMFLVIRKIRNYSTLLPIPARITSIPSAFCNLPRILSKIKYILQINLFLSRILCNIHFFY